MTQARMASAIISAYCEAERLTDRWGGIGHGLDDSRDIAARQERQHRAFGHRLVGADIGKRASVRTCAMFFALKFYTNKSERSFEHRADFVAAYGMAERVCYSAEGRKAYNAAKRRARAVLAFDYIDMIEGRRAKLDAAQEAASPAAR